MQLPVDLVSVVELFLQQDQLLLGYCVLIFEFFLLLLQFYLALELQVQVIDTQGKLSLTTSCGAPRSCKALELAKLARQDLIKFNLGALIHINGLLGRHVLNLGIAGLIFTLLSHPGELLGKLSIALL